MPREAKVSPAAYICTPARSSTCKIVLAPMIAHPLKLTAQDLTVMRGPRAIFAGLSFAVVAGEALILTGPNGIGKTTLLRSIAGFMPLAEGRFQLDGQAQDTALGEVCHFIGHLNGVKPSLTVSETLRFFEAFLGKPGGGAKNAAETLGLETLADIPAGYLSAGQKRRLGLARLLCAKRPIWLLDEPAVSLDRRSQAILASMVNAHLAEGGIAIAATHTDLGWQNARSFDLAAAAPRHFEDAL